MTDDTSHHEAHAALEADAFHMEPLSIDGETITFSCARDHTQASALSAVCVRELMRGPNASHAQGARDEMGVRSWMEYFHKVRSDTALAYQFSPGVRSVILDQVSLYLASHPNTWLEGVWRDERAKINTSQAVLPAPALTTSEIRKKKKTKDRRKLASKTKKRQRRQ